MATIQVTNMSVFVPSAEKNERQRPSLPVALDQFVSDQKAVSTMNGISAISISRQKTW